MPAGLSSQVATPERAGAGSLKATQAAYGYCERETPVPSLTSCLACARFHHWTPFGSLPGLKTWRGPRSQAQGAPPLGQNGAWPAGPSRGNLLILRLRDGNQEQNKKQTTSQRTVTTKQSESL